MPKSRRRHTKHKGLKRKTKRRQLRERFLIVCEGKQTEPNYFRAFRVPKDVKVVGTGKNTISVVKKAIHLMAQDDYDQVWCVFDKDEFPEQHFREALHLAKKHNIKVAYSNEAFELWFLLHFDYHHSSSSRHQYAQKLTKRLGIPYEKNRSDMYQRLEDKQATAIRNAEKLLRSYRPHRPEKDNPCTTVHLLVQALNEVSV